MAAVSGGAIVIESNDPIAHNYHQFTPRAKVHLRELFEKIDRSYSNDPGTSDLYDEQPVGLTIDLGDVRLVRRLLR